VTTKGTRSQLSFNEEATTAKYTSLPTRLVAVNQVVKPSAQLLEVNSLCVRSALLPQTDTDNKTGMVRPVRNPCEVPFRQKENSPLYGVGIDQSLPKD
jgi:hypothetical protein